MMLSPFALGFLRLMCHLLLVQLRGQEKKYQPTAASGESKSQMFLSEKGLDIVTTRRPGERSVSSMNVTATPRRGLINRLSF